MFVFGPLSPSVTLCKANTLLLGFSLTMVIGLLEMRLSMPENCSLKDKRMVLRSLKDRVHNRFNVSIAEVAEHDRWTEAQLAAAVVSVDCTHAHQILESVVKYVEGRGDVVLRDYQIQML